MTSRSLGGDEGFLASAAATVKVKSASASVFITLIFFCFFSHIEPPTKPPTKAKAKKNSPKSIGVILSDDFSTFDVEPEGFVAIGEGTEGEGALFVG